MAKGKQLKVTDHAVVRYLERVHGISLDHVRAEMTTPAAKMLGRNGFSGNVQLPGKAKGVIVDGAMVTVLR